jgi:uncharacterized protein (DUF1684 family)
MSVHPLTTLVIALLLTLLPNAAATTDVSPASPVRLTSAEADSLTQAILKDRADTEQWLKSGETSYLATIQRVDFGARPTLTVGRDPGNDVCIADSSVSPRHLRVTVAGDSFRVEAADTGAVYRLKGEVQTRGTMGPSGIGIGRFTLRLSHQRFPAIIVFDPKSPNFARYKGLKWFPVDFSRRYLLPLTPNPKPDTTLILSTRGNRRRAVRVGWFDFMVGRTRCRLEATRLLEPGVGENDVSVFFRDATTGKESYATGRYVDPERLQDGRYLLDFNLGYNPACAVSEHYNCPIPPKENTLKVPIRAGEMDAHYH